MAALGLMVGLHALAQESSTKPSQQTPGDGAKNGPQEVQLIFTPWTRYCAQGLAEKSSEIRTKKVCFTASDGHLPSGQKMAIVLLIEPEGSADAKLLALRCLSVCRSFPAPALLSTKRRRWLRRLWSACPKMAAWRIFKPMPN
ncbi:MAG TPA: hypothetical protein VGG11_00085 [Xanthobacteraceae bacterium]